MADASKPPVFDPVEAAKVTVGATPPPKKPPEPPKPPVQVRSEPAPKPKKRFLVTKTRTINSPGNAGITTLAEGSIVSEQTYDMENLRRHGVQMQPLDD